MVLDKLYYHVSRNRLCMCSRRGSWRPLPSLNLSKRHGTPLRNVNNASLVCEE